MRDGELLYMSKKLCEMLDKDNVVVFRDDKKQPYAIFKVADKEGAVANFGGGHYIIETQSSGEGEE